MQMEDRDKLIEVLERVKTTILEVQTKFSEAADLFSRKRAYDLTEIPSGKSIISYFNQNEKEALTEYDRLIRDGNYLKDIITNAQAKFLFATRVVSNRPVSGLTEEQAVKIQQEINQATIDIVSYSDLLRRLYEAVKIPRSES
jgi:hypothetical protein